MNDNEAFMNVYVPLFASTYNQQEAINPSIYIHITSNHITSRQSQKRPVAPELLLVLGIFAPPTPQQTDLQAISARKGEKEKGEWEWEWAPPKPEVK